MVILDTYSKRRKEELGLVSDVFQYDSLPSKIRIQIRNLIQASFDKVDSIYCNPIGRQAHQLSDQMFEEIVETLRHEFGVEELNNSQYNLTPSKDELFKFICNEEDIGQVLDTIEYVFQIIRNMKFEDTIRNDIIEKVDEVIHELNIRFKENGIGYQFENNKLLRIDNTFLHNETVKPALGILSDPIYQVAQDEFIDAFEHYRHSRNKEAIECACKSLESVLKIICAKRGWGAKDTDNAKKLIEICFTKNLIDPIMKDYWDGLQQILLSGVPKIRNKRASHGQGDKPYPVPDYLVSYVFHMTAASIVMLVNAEKSLI